MLHDIHNGWNKWSNCTSDRAVIHAIEFTMHNRLYDEQLHDLYMIHGIVCIIGRAVIQYLEQLHNTWNNSTIREAVT